MNGTITSIEKKPAKTGGYFYYVFFSLEDGKSAKTCVYPKYRNFKRWESLIKSFESGLPVSVTGLIFKKDRLVDADSPVR